MQLAVFLSPVSESGAKKLLRVVWYEPNAPIAYVLDVNGKKPPEASYRGPSTHQMLPKRTSEADSAPLTDSNETVGG